MAAPLILRVITDGRQAFKTNAELVGSYTAIGDVALKNAPNFAKAAETQVAANAKVIQSQRLLLAETRKVQAATALGSDERIAANVAVANAEARLNRAMGISTVAIGRTAAASKEAERDFGKLTRGALAGSGVFSALGRSLAFASGGFLAVAGGAALISKSIQAALDLAASQRQVDTQLKVSGKSWDQYGKQIDAANEKLLHVSGFTDVELLQSFTTLFRATGNVSESLHLNAVAADVARGRHVALAAASNALAKASQGSFAALRRLNIIVPQGSTVMEALAFVQKKYAGQAEAGTTAADRFRASLVHTEDIVGTALLPTFDRLVTRLGDWLAKANETGRIQRDVNEAVTIAGDVFHTLGGIVKVVDTVTGSFANTLKIVIGLKIASTVATWLTALDALAARWVLVGNAAKGAAASEALALGAGAGGAGAVVGAEAGAGAAVGGFATGAALKRVIQERRTASRLPASFNEYINTSGRAATATENVSSKMAGLSRAASKFSVIASLALLAKPAEQASSSVVGKLFGGHVRSVYDYSEGFFTGGLIGKNPRDAVLRWIYGPPAPQYANIKPFAFPTLSNLFGGHPGRLGPVPIPIPQIKNFQIDTAEQIAQAQAALTATTDDDVKVAKGIISRIKLIIWKGKVHGQALVQALEAEAAALGVVQSAADAAKQKAAAQKAARATAAATYNIPINLQVAQASLDAYGKDTTGVLKQIIAAAQKAIASGKKSGEGVVAAYGVIQSAQQALTAKLSEIPIKLQLELAKAQAFGGDQTAILKKEKAALLLAYKKAKGNQEAQIAILGEIANINQTLGSAASSARGQFRQLNINKITRGLHLTVEQAKALRSQLSQIGPGGTVPGGGVGAYGFAIAGGGTVHHHHHLYIDGKEVESSTRKHGHKRKQRNSSQRRGPNAGWDD